MPPSSPAVAMTWPAVHRSRWPALLMAFAAPMAAWGQGAACSSDSQPRPLAILERFINADCGECWTDPATPRPGARALALDWIVPGSGGQEAALSAAATRDGLARLKALGRPVPAKSQVQESRLLAAARTLRVAHGLPLNDYMGASIELKPAGKGPWSAWLALVESLPAGTEGSPVARNLVRTVFQPPWDLRRLPSRAEQKRLFDSRPLRIPEGANPQRLTVVGWVQDARGRVRAIAQSRCVPSPDGEPVNPVPPR